MTQAFRFYCAGLLVLAATGLLFSGWSHGGAGPAHWNAIAAFAVLGFVSEAYAFRLRVGRAETQSSVSFIPFIASYLLLDTGWAAAVCAASMVAAEVIVRHKPLHRILFNTAQVTVSIVSASLVYKALGGIPSLSTFELAAPGVAVSVVVYFGINSTAVTFAIVFDLREKLWAAWRRIAGVSLFYDLFSAVLAPALAFLYVTWQIAGILILILPLYFVRHLYQVSLQLEQVNRDLLELMVKAIEARDPYTSGHSQRVAQFAESLARDFGLTARQVEQTRTAALLHDVGKIHEEYAPLLRKEGKLDPTEKALMQTHSTRSAELVGTISAFRGSITESVRHHHENYDGTGYPSGLAARAIPIGARIIMIADTVDAMTTDRPYRKALTYDRVVAELSRFAGTQFDPALVETFLKSTAIRHLVVQRTSNQKDSQIAVNDSPVYLPWRRSATKRRPASAGTD